MEELFCIKHGEMVMAQTCPVGTCVIGHEFTVTDEEYPFFEVDFCEFELGWATCAPPEFDFDEWMSIYGDWRTNESMTAEAQEDSTVLNQEEQEN